jgi:hypothetical protein
MFSGISSGSVYFRGPSDCLRYLLRTQGIRGVYKGFPLQGMRDIPASGIYFLSYEWLFVALRSQRWSDAGGIRASLFAGGTAGVLSWLAIMPLDVVKNIYQADAGREHRAYNSIPQCAADVYRRGGVRAFYTGAGMACLRAFPVNAVTFMVHNHCMKMLQNRH